MKRCELIKLYNISIAIMMGLLLPACNEDVVSVVDAKASKTEIAAKDFVEFIDNSTEVLSRIWTFPNGTPATSTRSYEKVYFVKGGTVFCTLNVTFLDGTESSEEFVVQVSPLNPSIQATASIDEVKVLKPIHFSDHSLDVASRIWTFPGGMPETSMAEEVTVNFAEEGSYVCTLQVEFIDETIQYQDFEITVIPYVATIDAEVSAFITNINSEIIFSDNSQDVVSRVWSFPGAIPVSSSEQEVSVLFLEPGQTTCELMITFIDGTVLTETFVIEVIDDLYVHRSIFGFEDETKALQFWNTWISDSSDAIEFFIDPSQGANNTSSSGKILFKTTSGVTAQLFTKDNSEPINAVILNNKTYTFSFWIKSDNIHSISDIGLYNKTNVQQWHSYLWVSPLDEITSEWKKMSFTFESGDVYQEGQANNVYIQLKFNPTELGEIHIDEFSLREILE